MRVPTHKMTVTTLCKTYRETLKFYSKDQAEQYRDALLANGEHTVGKITEIKK